jgi:hypothetical protein
MLDVGRAALWIRAPVDLSSGQTRMVDISSVRLMEAARMLTRN